MTQGSIRKMFPGGNTSQGFYSLYDYLIEPNARRIFVIKGGPGVGKSSLMKAIAEKVVEKGLNIEMHYCSSDNDSLDGLVIPSKNIALVDGTAPHIVDPKNPGVVDEIINLGEFWDEKKIVANKDNVLAINKKVGRYFSIAYSRLKEAKVAHDEWESYVTESMDFAKVNTLSKILLDEVFSLRGDIVGYGKTRHLFASAITPDGLVHYYQTLISDCKVILLVEGQPGSGKSILLQKVNDTAITKGFYVEAYHCPFDPSKLDLVIIPSLKTAVLNNTHPISANIDSLNTSVIKTFDLNTCVNNNILSKYARVSADAEKRFQENLMASISLLGKAKEAHDLMETYYIPNMDFEAINAKRDEILNRILSY